MMPSVVWLKYCLFDTVKHFIEASGVKSLGTYEMVALVHTWLHLHFAVIDRFVIYERDIASRYRTLLRIRRTNSGSLHGFVSHLHSIICYCFGTNMGRSSTIKSPRRRFEGLLQSMQNFSETYNHYHVDYRYWSCLHHPARTAIKPKRIYRNIWNIINPPSLYTWRRIIPPISVGIIQHSGKNYQTKNEKTCGSEERRLHKVKVMPQCYYCNKYFEYAVCPYDGSQLYSDTDQYHCDKDHDLRIPEQYRFVEKYTSRQTVAACPFCRTPYLYTDLPPPLKKQFNIARGAARCFIATATYGTPFAHEINILREWRDFKLRKSVGGRIFVKVYYVVSPPIALIIANSEKLKCLTKKILTPIVIHFKRKYHKH